MVNELISDGLSVQSLKVFHSEVVGDSVLVLYAEGQCDEGWLCHSVLECWALMPSGTNLNALVCWNTD